MRGAGPFMKTKGGARRLICLMGGKLDVINAGCIWVRVKQQASEKLPVHDTGVTVVTCGF